MRNILCISMLFLVFLTTLGTPSRSNISSTHILYSQAEEQRSYTTADYVKDGLVCLWDGNFGGVNKVVNVTFGNGIETSKNLDRDYLITKELTDFDFSRNIKSFWIFQRNGAGFATQIGLRFYEMWIREGEDIVCSIVPVRFVNESGQKRRCRV